jgi:hypothetical protein
MLHEHLIHLRRWISCDLWYDCHHTSTQKSLPLSFQKDSAMTTFVKPVFMYKYMTSRMMLSLSIELRPLRCFMGWVEVAGNRIIVQAISGVRRRRSGAGSYKNDCSCLTLRFLDEPFAGSIPSLIILMARPPFRRE